MNYLHTISFLCIIALPRENYATSLDNDSEDEKYRMINGTVVWNKHVYRMMPPYWLQLAMVYSIPVIIVLGVIGNVMAFIIFKESAMKTSSHFYITCLTIFDTLTLLSIVFSVYSGVILKEYYHALDNHDNWVRKYLRRFYICQCRIFVSFVFRTMSVWTIVIFSCERCFAVKRPISQRPMRRAIISITTIIICSLVLNSHVLFGYDNVDGECKNNEIFRLGVVFTIILQTLVPWVIVFVCNIIIIKHLRESDRMRLTEEIDVPIFNEVSRSVIFKLILISITFLVTTFPILVGTMWMWIVQNTKMKSTTYSATVLWNAAFIPLALNFSCNFLLYCCTGQKFRRAAFYLVTCQIELMRQVRSSMDPSRSVKRRRHIQNSSGHSTQISSTMSTRVTLLRESSYTASIHVKTRSKLLSDNTLCDYQKSSFTDTSNTPYEESSDKNKNYLSV